jgi:hypothetical protein
MPGFEMVFISNKARDQMSEKFPTIGLVECPFELHEKKELVLEGI